MDDDLHNQLASLVGEVRKGDIQAYGRIVELTRAIVEATARVIVHDPSEAEDVAQETYLQAYHSLDALRDPASLLSWLQRIARNLALNRRRASRWSFVRDVDVSDIAEPAYERDERAQDLARAMVSLRSEDRRLCERYYHAGWTTARLADEMAISEATVRKRLQRIRERLRRGMAMSDTELPQRIVDMLSKPDLTAMPENPVGAIWEEFRQRYDGFTELVLPEKVDPEEARGILGDGVEVEEYLASISQQQWLRTSLTVPMLIVAAKAGGSRLIATGKTYRAEGEETSTKLHTFHQAEVLWVEEDLSEWHIMGQFTQFVDQVSAGARLRIEHADFPLYCERGWKVEIEWLGKAWNSVAGWGRMKPDIVERLGYDASRFTAVGIGIGLERLAMQRYGIDDIRRMEAERI